MGTRAQGANTVLTGAFESSYGTPPSSGYYQLSYSAEDLGEEQTLVPSDLLGQGRDPDAPSQGPIDNKGSNLKVPVDLRLFGFWLKLLLGAPTTTAGLAAEGSITFSENPSKNDTITINGSVLTFGTDITIGDSLSDTVSNTVLALNESDDTNISAATYSMNADGTEIDVVYDAAGTAGNAFTLAASAATVSGSTLSGGTEDVAATGSIVFSANPSSGDTITVNGTAFTFGTDITIGDDLSDTIDNAVSVLNASTNSAVDVATYAASSGTTIEVTYDTLGTAGNAFTLAASAATVSGSTLSGGVTCGVYQHVFTSGLTDLPSASLEVGHADIDVYKMNYGFMADTIAIPMERSGNLDATITYQAQGEKDPTSASAVSSKTELDIVRFSQFTGSVKRSGVTLGNVVSASWQFSNGLDAAEDIREDGRIDGLDPGQTTSTGTAVLRFRDTVLANLASNNTPIELVHSWKISSSKKLIITNHKVYLPKSKTPVTGPGGIQQTLSWQSAKDSTAGCMVTATLINDVESY